MTVYPTQLERVSEDQLLIEWSDGQRRQYTHRELRDHCPCSACRGKHSTETDEAPTLLPIVSDAETQPLRITGMKPVGNYAYSITFSDGHDTGLYTMENLRELGRAVD